MKSDNVARGGKDKDGAFTSTNPNDEAGIVKKLIIRNTGNLADRRHISNIRIVDADNNVLGPVDSLAGDTAATEVTLTKDT